MLKGPPVTAIWLRTKSETPLLVTLSGRVLLWPLRRRLKSSSPGKKVAKGPERRWGAFALTHFDQGSHHVPDLMAQEAISFHIKPDGISPARKIQPGDGAHRGLHC